MVISEETKKRFILSIISTFLSLALFVVLGEAFLSFRYDQWRSDFGKSGDWYGGLTTVSENPILMWEYRPNAKSNVPGLTEIRTNRYGFRDYDYETMGKPSGVFRIAFIGDSVTAGYNVDSQSTFIRKFENYAKNSHSNLKIQPMNFGIDGYNINQIFELLTSRVLLFEPDKIVYIMCLNDFDFEESSGEKIRYFNKPNSFIIEKLERLFRRLLKIDFHLWHYEKNKKQVFEKIVEIKRILLAQSFDFQIILLPVFNIEDSKNSFISYPLSEVHLKIGQFFKKNHIEFVDLLEAFRNQEKPPKYFAYDVWHPNKEGHDFIAKQLLEPLLKGI